VATQLKADNAWLFCASASEHQNEPLVLSTIAPGTCLKQLIQQIADKMYINKESGENGEGEKDPLTQQVIGCAIEVHRTLGPGLLESTYEKCLAHELKLAGLPFINQAVIPIDYKGISLDCGYRLDFLIDDYLVVELKAVEQILPIHQAQVITYMKLAEAPVGILINFNVKLLKDGIRRLFPSPSLFSLLSL
jgi:GxxExxY protein